MRYGRVSGACSLGRRDQRCRASSTEIIPAAANMQSLSGHVGGTSGIGRRTPTTDPHTWHRSRSTYTFLQTRFSGLCDKGENYSRDASDLAQPSRLLSRFDTDFVTCLLLGHRWLETGDSRQSWGLRCSRCGKWLSRASNQDSERRGPDGLRKNPSVGLPGKAPVPDAGAQNTGSSPDA